MVKILFLDIDGVLNSAEWYKYNQTNILNNSGLLWRSLEELDPDACFKINKLCLEEGAQIVITSTWRKLHTIDNLREMFFKRGITVDILDYTPHIPNDYRGAEVMAWLENHPEVTKYVILDDDHDFFAGQPLVLTDWGRGILDHDIEKARSILRA